MSDYTKLIELMRHGFPILHDCREAADALEAQAKEILALKSLVKKSLQSSIANATRKAMEKDD